MKLKNIFWSVAALILWASSASADITRHCEGSLYLTAIASPGYPAEYESMGSLLGRGSCANSIQANKCRQAARAEIGKCLSQLWTERNANKIPSSCSSLVSGSSRNGARLTYDGILGIEQSQRLTARAARYLCCNMRPNENEVPARFDAVVTGDEKCGSVKTGNNRYQDDVEVGQVMFHCDLWRDNGICN